MSTTLARIGTDYNAAHAALVANAYLPVTDWITLKIERITDPLYDKIVPDPVNAFEEVDNRTAAEKELCDRARSLKMRRWNQIHLRREALIRVMASDPKFDHFV